VKAPIPPDVLGLLWDIEAAATDDENARPLIIERVMTRGSLAAMRWLLASYEPDVLRQFLSGPAGGRLPPRELAFWCAVLGLEVPARGRSAGGGRPGWAG